MKRLIDTHSHLFLEEFSEDLQDVVERSVKAGVDTFVMPCINLHSLPLMYQVKSLYPEKCHLTIGLHPTDISGSYMQELREMKNILDDSAKGADGFCAVGEVGLDLYWDRSTLSDQLRVFSTQIEWALEYDLPLIIHFRSATDELCCMLDRYAGSGLRGVFHCFSGNGEEVERLLGYEGFMFGIGGVLTYRKSELRSSLPLIPRNRVIPETDCPYLSPIPFRGRRNEPSFMVETVKQIADVWGCDADETACVLTANSCSLFGIS